MKRFMCVCSLIMIVFALFMLFHQPIKVSATSTYDASYLEVPYIRFQASEYKANFEKVFGSTSGSYANIYYNTMAAAPDIQQGIKNWEALHLASNPLTAITGQKWISQQDMYKLAIFDMLNVGHSVPGIIDTISNDANEYVISVSSEILDRGLNLDALKTMPLTDENYTILSSAFQVKGMFAALEFLEKSVGVIGNFWDAANCCASYQAIAEMDENVKTLLCAIANDTANPIELRQAASECVVYFSVDYNIVYQHLMNKATAESVATTLVDTSWDLLAGSIPIISQINIGTKGIMIITDGFFDLNDTYETYYLLKATVGLENAVRRIMNNYYCDFISQTTNYNSEYYMSIIEMYKRTILDGFDHSIRLLQIQADAPGVFILDMFGVSDYDGAVAACRDEIALLQILKQEKHNRYATFESGVKQKYIQTYAPIAQWDVSAYSNGSVIASLYRLKSGQYKLVISGKGPMRDYERFNRPWWNDSYNYYDNIGMDIVEVIIHYGVTSIGDQSFDTCPNLTSVTIPDSVTSIGNWAFSGCNSLSNVRIPDSVTNIGQCAFSGCYSIASITIPHGVTNIRNYTFSGCRNLTSVTISHSVTSIGDEAFEDCSSLKSVTIPQSVNSIGHYAFRNCSLTSVTIPHSVASIGDSPFVGCSNLTGIWVNKNNPSYSSDSNGILFNKEQTILIQAPSTISGENIIPDSVTHIKRLAFYNCSNLISVVIPESVIKVEPSAFMSCQNLVSVTSKSGLYDNMFSNCPRLQRVTLSGKDIKIAGSLFYKCDQLSDIFIEENTTISNYIYIEDPDSLPCDCFMWDDNTICVCYNKIENVHVPNLETWLGLCKNDWEITHRVITEQWNLYVDNQLVREIEIPNSITSIGASAFKGCTNLTSVTLPDSVTSIGRSAFKGCTSLTGIWVDENNPSYSSDSIGVLFDKSQTNLIQAPSIISGEYIIPNTVSSISDYAFANCSNLTGVIYCGTEGQWDSITIGKGNAALTSVQRSYHNWMNATCITPKICTICGDTDGEVLGHSYITEIFVKPTFATTGQQQKICSSCGDTMIETLDMLIGKVSQWNITLKNDFRLNFYLQVSEGIESTTEVRLTIGTDIATYKISDLVKTEDGYFKLTANISAAQVNDFITVMVMNGREIGCNNTYTAREYCDTILADEAHSKYHALVKEMLNYGAMAQIYFDYDTENLANDGITGVASEEVPETAEEMIVIDKINSLNFYGASLVYRDRIAVRYYFTCDMTGCTFTANGNTYTPVAKDGMYYIEIADILPQDLDQQIMLTVTDAAGNELSVTYGPMNYIVRMNEKGSTELQNLLKALYNYHLAAKAL